MDPPAQQSLRMTAPIVSSSSLVHRLRNAAVLLALLAAVYALLGFLVGPVLLKPRLEAHATELLGRRVTLARLEFNPFTLRARLLDFVLAGREPQRPLARFATLDLDVALASLWKRAPVLDAVRLVRPHVDITRNADGTYGFDDIVERLAAAPPQRDASPSLFSVNNIEVDDASLSFDDRPHRRTIVLSSIGIGIPFLSSFPYDAKIRVTPRLEGAVDGTRFALTGTSTSPFAETQEGTLDLNLDALPLPRYAEYAPLPEATRLADGTLTTRLRLAFVTQQGAARTMSLSGTARVDKVAMTRKDGSPLAGAASIDLKLARLDPLARSIRLGQVVVDAPEVDLKRDASGALEIMRLLAGSTPPAPSRPWTIAVDDARVSGGTLRVADDAVAPPFRAVLSNVAFDGKQLASSGGTGNVTLAFDGDDGAHFMLQGKADPGKSTADGHFSLTKLDLPRLQPYYASAVGAEVRRGKLDVAGDFVASPGGESPRITLAGGSATLSDFDAALRGERRPFLRVASANVDGVELDAARHSITIGKAEWRGGSVRVQRQRDGTIDLARIMRAPSRSADADRPPTGSAAGDDAWRLLVRKVIAERVAADFEDRAVDPPVGLRIPDVRFAADDMSNARGAKIATEAVVRIGSTGRVRVKGTLVADPLAADYRVDMNGVDLVSLRPYLEARTNVIVTSGFAGAKGRVTYRQARGGTPRVTYAGDVTVTNFASLDRPTSQDLMRWKTLTLTGIDAASEPFTAAIDAIGMDAFYARVIVNPDATLNLQQLLASETAPAVAPTPPPRSSPTGAATKELAPSRTSELPVSIGRMHFSDGEVQYSDFFVKPNYTTHLTGVSGDVSALSAAQSGTVALAGRVEGTAPVDVRGTVNPFAQQLQLDLTGKATDIDLPPLTPYSVKYAGYGIQKGKLSLEVHYRIADRKLVATNKLKLDQLTFGERVDSPTATKLPVLLAVSLLKDRNGVINLDLPIGGTLDDPQFSVWGVLVQIFVNLITKAVTAPFALLSSIGGGGGGGEQLAYVQFAPGHAELSAAAQAKLGTLAKALADRPALKIDATGRAIPDIDREGLSHAMLDRAVRLQKQKALAAQGQSAPPLDSLTVAATEYPELLAAVYKAADLPDKPRNVLGFAKTIPAADMETLLLKSYRVDDEALRDLANRRAQTVKSWLADQGHVSPERVFVVAPKLTRDGITDQDAPARVDFAIR